MLQKHASLSFATIGLFVLAACAPGQTTPAAGQPGAQAAPQPEKGLIIAIQREPASFDNAITGTGVAIQGGSGNPSAMVQDSLTRITHLGDTELQLAAELPSDTRGTWVVNPNGSMDVTWKIRSDAKWHDGTPVTAADFEFAFKLRSDPEVAGLPTGSGAVTRIGGVTATGPYTVVTHWPQASILGLTGFDPLAKHILEPTYVQDKQALGSHRYFTTEFVGTGPFKLVRWEQGSHMDFERFENYYRGPAKLSRVTVKFIPDANTMAANILAEAVDVLLPPGVDVEVAIELKTRWEQQGSGHQVLMEKTDRLEQLELMVDPVYARPVNGLPQQPVRQALLQAIDRQELMQAMTGGLSEVPDSFYHPADENYPFVRDEISKYVFPYDPRRSQELLAGAGWVKGADGMLVHQPSGERFSTQVLVRQGSGPVKQGTIVADYWKAVGVSLDVHALTTAENADNEFQSTYPGARAHTGTGAAFYGTRMHSSRIPRPETRWTGDNRGRNNSPVVDRLVDAIPITINQDARMALHKQLIAEITGKVIPMPFYWQILPIPMLKGVTGPRLVSQLTTGNIWEWDYNK
ncbi:MAG: hypothetical protein HY534_07990 [Chloroflexi bacterium]|nr:hypothetical protein [Chloroflexota bacterium]